MIGLVQSRIGMELRQLRYVDAVATHRHFTRAAAAIGVAQPALSHQIKRLEDELGVELFHRSRAGVDLTEAGAVLLARSRRALAELEAGREELAALAGLRTGRVRLGAMQALGELDLPHTIAAFHREHPGVEVTLTEESTTQMHELVRDGRLDLALVALEVERPGALDAAVVTSEPVLLALPRGHRLAGRDTVAAKELRREPFVFFRAGTGLRSTVEAIGRQAGFTPRMAFETGNLERLLALVREGLGVSLIPASTARGAGDAIRVVALDPPLTRTIGVIWRADQTLPPGARAMRALLTDGAQAATPGG